MYISKKLCFGPKAQSKQIVSLCLLTLTDNVVFLCIESYWVICGVVSHVATSQWQRISTITIQQAALIPNINHSELFSDWLLIIRCIYTVPQRVKIFKYH